MHFRLIIAMISVLLFMAFRPLTLTQLQSEVVASENSNTGHYYTSSHIKDDSVQEIDEETAKLVGYLKRKGSPIASVKYAKIIIETSEQYNADYRTNVGIMMVESGLCRQSFRYNCYGYLNGRKYSSYEEALTHLTAEVSKNYTAKYGANLNGMAHRYGPHNKEHWVKNVYKVMNDLG